MKILPSLLRKYNIPKLTILLLCIVLGVVLTQAQQIHQLTFVLKEVQTDNNISNITLQIKEINLDTGKQLTITEYLNSNTIEIYLSEGNYELTFIADDTQTPGKDYYGNKKITSMEPKQEVIYLFPVASLRGLVLDRLENLLKDAEVEIMCDQEFITFNPLMTDKYGTFSIPTIPTGNCAITTSYKEYFDQQQLAFNRGDMEQVQLRLERKLSSATSIWVITLFGIIIITAIASVVVYWFRIRNRRGLPSASSPLTKKSLLLKKRKSNNGMDASQQHLPSRVLHILPTLRDRERAIVQFLLDNHHSSTQAKIKHATKIPKTSLMRTLETLKQKNIVEIESTMMQKTIKLTLWFLENEKTK